MLSQFISLCNTIKNIYTNPLKRITMAIVQVQQNIVFEVFFFFFFLRPSMNPVESLDEIGHI